MQIYFQSKSVEFTPVQRGGAPLSVNAPMETPWQVGTIDLPGGGKRTIMMRLARKLDGSGRVRLKSPQSPSGGGLKEYRLLYKKPNGGIFEFPAVEDASGDSEDGQTVRNTAISEDGTSQDLYIAKGFTYATPQDVFAAMDRAERNAAAAEQRKTAQDPSQQVALLAQTMASSLAQASQGNQRQQSKGSDNAK